MVRREVGNICPLYSVSHMCLSVCLLLAVEDCGNSDAAGQSHSVWVPDLPRPVSCWFRSVSSYKALCLPPLLPSAAGTSTKDVTLVGGEG